MQRAAVIGASGAGKTTFARALAARMGVAHVELDALHWEPGWQAADLPTFRARVDAATTGDAWVVDGSYTKVRDLVWARADTVVWLDYTLAVKLTRLVLRTARRLITGEELWNGNRERLRDHLNWREDNLVRWSLQQHGRHKREYPAALAEPRYAHLRLVRLSTPAEAERWLTTVARPSERSTI
jgi:adenylate kinase family enzyme